MRWATPAELARWDRLIAANPDGGQALQSRAWGRFKGGFGWRPAHVVYEGLPGLDGPLAALWLRRRFAGFGEMWYCPKGPGIASERQLLAVVAQRELFGGGFVARLEPELPEAVVRPAAWTEAGLRKTPFDVQLSRATIVVDLRPDEDALLAAFHHKTRYNIRLAMRHGVVVRSADAGDASIALMYRLMRATQDRAGFALRPESYFAGYWRAQAAADQGRFFFAEHQGEVLAGAFITHLATKGWYKDGGSFKHRHSLMAPYLVQWEVMRWLRARGVTAYDLVAVPRQSELQDAHPMAGLYRFKSGFNPEITEFVGTWDLPLSARRYRAWNAVGERIAHAYQQRRRGEPVY